MGTWGVYPQDNDLALDYQCEIDKVISKKISEIFAKDKHYGNRWSLVGLIILNLKAGHFLSRKDVATCIEYLSDYEADEDWLDGWIDKKHKDNDRKKVIQAIKLIKSELQKLLDEGRGNDKTILAPRGWLTRDFENKKGASRSGLFELHDE